MPCCNRSQTETLAQALLRGLRLELHLTPKPGLVDRWDSGSHSDLSRALMRRSICQFRPYFCELIKALEAKAPFHNLVAIGQQAEHRMLSRFHTNTHRGGIFLSGLLLCAAHRSPSLHHELLSKAVAEIARGFFVQPRTENTNGQRVRATLGTGGIVEECLHGMPNLFHVALPAYHSGMRLTANPRLSAFFMMARLMQTVEDTTTLHRTGTLGLARLRHDGGRLKEAIVGGEDILPLLQQMNNDYRRMNLTMGGVADLMGMAFGLLVCEKKGAFTAEDAEKSCEA